MLAWARLREVSVSLCLWSGAARAQECGSDFRGYVWDFAFPSLHLWLCVIGREFALSPKAGH